MTPLRPNLIQETQAVLAGVLKVPVSEVRLACALREDLGVDSVDFWDIVASFDRKFGVTISVQEAAKLITVQDLISALQAKLGQT